MLTNTNRTIPLTLDSNDLGELLLRQPVPQNRVQASRLKHVLHQFSFDLDGRFLHCWCGGDIQMDYAGHGIPTMTQAVVAFCRAHEDCSPREELSA